MISFLLGLALATTVYIPMTNQLETTIAHYFIQRDFHSKKKDMIVVSWIDCKDQDPKPCCPYERSRGYPEKSDIQSYTDNPKSVMEATGQAPRSPSSSYSGTCIESDVPSL